MTKDTPRSGTLQRLASLFGDRRRQWALVVLLAILVLPSLADGIGRQWLEYDRNAIAAGEYWRLISGHWVHLGARHLALNALGLVLLWALFARDYRPQHWLIIVAASIAAIDAGLWWRAPEVSWYVGASGWLHGVLAAGVWAHLRRGDSDRWLLALTLAAKLIVEQRTALPFAGDMAVITQAHLYGVIGALAVALWLPVQPEPL